MKSVHPYLNFPGNTEEAFEFYRSVFGGDYLDVIRYRDLDDGEMGVPEEELDRIAHIALPLGPHAMLMATDHVSSFPGEFRAGNNFYITIEPESADEARMLYDSLSEGGKAEMPLQRTGWAELHGHVRDRFGVHWMLDYTGDAEDGTGG